MTTSTKGAAATRHHTRRARGSAAGGFRLSPTLLFSVATLSVAIAVGLFLLTRTSTSSAAVGQVHTLGAAGAPVLVEEWSDFQ